MSERLREVTDLLESLAADREPIRALPEADRIRFLNAVGDVFCPDPEERRLRVKARRREQRAARLRQDESVLDSTGIRVLRAKPVFTTPNVFPPEEFEQRDVDVPDFREVLEEQHCYVCKVKYRQVHHFYDQLCPECAEFNYAKRTESADLSGRVALLTGGRVKIGYQAGVKLLRAGAELIVTTRFPRDSAMRYAQEADFEEWGDRLEIYGLDLRHTPSVEQFCRHLDTTRSRLDYIVNNACQTVRRPPEFYRHMMELESGPLRQLPSDAAALLGGVDGLTGYDLLSPGDGTGGVAVERTGDDALPDSAALSQLPLLPEDTRHAGHLFPGGQLDQDLQQVDLRERNSWRLTLAEVSSVEMLETQLVNAVAPFVLNARLKPLMLRTPGAGQAHRERVGGRGAVLPALQDDEAPAHEHGEGRAQHDDPDLCDGVRPGRHPHEQRRHGLGQRRGPGAHRRAQDRRAPVPPAARHRRRRRAHRRSDHRRREHGPAPDRRVPQGLPTDGLVMRHTG